MDESPDQSLAVVPVGAVEHGVTPSEIEVSAETPEEMRSAQTNLISWCERKIASLQHDVDDLAGAHDIAKLRKWKTTTLARHRDIAQKRLEYYTKMLAAFKAGYMLVPNFPIGVFAIRTEREYPKRIYTTWLSNQHAQQPSLAPAGEGDYKNPEVDVFKETNKIPDGKGGFKEDVKYFTGDEWNDIDFPINMAKPHIMEVTNYAMGLKIFDEIGILPSRRKNVDPVICGTIKLKEGYSERVATFLLAWHIDTRTL